MAFVAVQTLDFGSPVLGDLDREMCAAAESVEGETHAGFDSGKPQAAKADDPGAEERSGVEIGHGRRKGVGEIFWDYRVFREPAIDGVAGELGVVTQVFAAPPRQYSQSPQVACSQAMPTRSPGLCRETPGPVRSTTPTI